MLQTRKNKPADDKNELRQIKTQSSFKKDIKLIQSYIKKDIKNPFIILTLLYESDKTCCPPSTLFYNAASSDNGYKLWHALSCSLPSSKEITASLTKEEDTTLRVFFSKIKFPEPPKQADRLISLLSIFFLYFPEYISSLPEDTKEKMHVMMFSELQKNYPENALKFSIFDVRHWLLSPDLERLAIRELKKLASVFSDKEWMKIFNAINFNLSNPDTASYIKSKSVNVFSELADHIPLHHHEYIIKKLLPYLSHRDTDFSSTVACILERFSYLISNNQRTYLLTAFHNALPHLKTMQIEFLGKLAATLNKNETLTAIEILCKKTYASIEKIKICAIKTLGNLSLTLQQTHHELITCALLNTLENTSPNVTIRSIHSLAKIASHSSNEQRKAIIRSLYSYFYKKYHKTGEFGEIPPLLNSILQNERVEIAFKFLSEIETMDDLKKFFAALHSEKCTELVISLCENFSDKDIFIENFHNKKIILTLEQLSPLVSKEQKAILVSLLFKKLCGHDLILSQNNLNRLENEEKIRLAKTFKALSPFFSETELQIALIKSQEMLIDGDGDGDGDIDVRKKAISALYKLTDYFVDEKLTNITKNLCDSIQELHGSNKHFIIKILNYLTPYFSFEQQELVSLHLKDVFMKTNNIDTIILAIDTLKKMMPLIKSKEHQHPISKICDELCNISFFTLNEKIEKQIIIALGHLSDIFSYNQCIKIMYNLLDYIAFCTYSLDSRDTFIKFFEQLLLNITPLDKANLYIHLITLEFAKERKDFLPLTDQLYASLYELPKVMPSREINNIIESYLAPSILINVSMV